MLIDESIKETVKKMKMIITRDMTLTAGVLVPIEKPGKDPRNSENYKPVVLLPAYIKLIAQNILNRIGPYIQQLSKTQVAYRSYRSTGEVVLARKYQRVPNRRTLPSPWLELICRNPLIRLTGTVSWTLSEIGVLKKAISDCSNSS